MSAAWEIPAFMYNEKQYFLTDNNREVAYNVQTYLF